MNVYVLNLMSYTSVVVWRRQLPGHIGFGVHLIRIIHVVIAVRIVIRIILVLFTFLTLLALGILAILALTALAAVHLERVERQVPPQGRRKFGELNTPSKESTYHKQNHTCSANS